VTLELELAYLESSVDRLTVGQTDHVDPHSNIAIPGYFGDDATRQMEAIRDFLYTYGGAAENPPAPTYDIYKTEKPQAKADASMKK
jgi:hypothetical protein